MKVGFDFHIEVYGLIVKLTNSLILFFFSGFNKLCDCDKMAAQSDKANQQLLATENQQLPVAPPSYQEAISKSAQASYTPSAPVNYDQLANYPEQNQQLNPSHLSNQQIGFSPVLNNQPIVNPPSYSVTHSVTDIKGPERIQPAPADTSVDDCLTCLMCCSICVDCCSIFQDCSS